MCEEGQQGPPLRTPLDEELVAHSHEISTVSGKCQINSSNRTRVAKRIRRHEILLLALTLFANALPIPTVTEVLDKSPGFSHKSCIWPITCQDAKEFSAQRDGELFSDSS